MSDSRNIFDLLQLDLLGGRLYERSSEDAILSDDSGSDEEYLPSGSGESDHSDDQDLDTESTEEPDSGDDNDAESHGHDSASDGPKTYKGKDGSSWSATPPPTSRVPARNIIRGPVEKVLHADHVAYVDDMFRLYITNDIVKEIVVHTNKEGQRRTTEKGKPADRWIMTDETEMSALLGILLTLGHMKQNNVDSDQIWSKEYGIQIVRCAMSQNRFKELLVTIRFDDKTTRGRRRANDKFAPIRNIWGSFHVEADMSFTYDH